MTVREEVRERIERDPQLVRLRKKIESGKATYAETAAYSIRAGKLLGEVFSRRLPEIPPEEREQLCVDLLHDQYIDINAAVDTVQRFRDEAQGFHLAPQHAPFDAERGHQIGSSLRDLSKPVETLQRRAKAATETATKAIHDDRMESEAKFRHKAGLDCRITRVAVNGCCPWCSDVAGRYVYGEEPDDIYRRHDNCDCTVTFENGRKRQDVWSKREWEAPEPGAGAGEPVRLTEEQAAVAGAGEPVVLSKEQAEALQKSVLTNAVERGRIGMNDRFYKEGDDPMFTAFGRAEDSNPKELAELQARLTAIGVRFERHDEEDAALAYQNTQVGKPGSISVTPNASYSAWLHEAKHAFDDFEAGWNACLAVWDVEEHIRREINAYQEEIDYAVSLSRQDIAKQLEQLRDDEIAEIRRRDEEYARLYEIYGEGGT